MTTTALKNAIAQIDELLLRLQADPGTAAHPSGVQDISALSLPAISRAEKPAEIAAAPSAPGISSTPPPSATSAAAAGEDSAVEGRPQGNTQKKVKPVKAPKAPPPEPTSADLFNKAHIQVPLLIIPTPLIPESDYNLPKDRQFALADCTFVIHMQAVTP